MKVRVRDRGCLDLDGWTDFSELTFKASCKIALKVEEVECGDVFLEASATVGCSLSGDIELTLKDNEEGLKEEESGYSGGKYWAKFRIPTEAVEGADGKVKVVATHTGVAGCEEEQTVDIPWLKDPELKTDDDNRCSDCGGDSSAGSGEAEVESADVSVNVGTLFDGRSAGKVKLHLEELTEKSAYREMLYYIGDVAEVETFADDGGLYQVKAPGTLAMITQTYTDAGSYVDPEDYYDAYEIRFYAEGDFSYNSTGQEATLVGTPTPFATWAVYNHRAGYDEYDTLTVVRYLGDPATGTAQIAYRYEYSEPAGYDHCWTLKTYDPGSSTLSGTDYYAPDAGDLVKTEAVTWWQADAINSPEIWTQQRLTTDDLSNTISEVVTVYEDFNWGRAPLSRTVTVGNSESNLVTTIDYYDSGDEQWNQRALVTHPDGSWKGYQYAAAPADQTTVIEGWLGTPAPANAQAVAALAYNDAGIRATVTTYSTTADKSLGRVSSVEEWIDGVRVRHTTYAYDDSVSGELEVTRTNHGPSSQELDTVTVIDLDNDERVKSTTDPGGVTRTYTYDAGTYTFSTTNPQYTTGTGIYGRTSVQTTPLVAGKSTKATTVRDAAGRTVLTETYVYDGSAFERVSWIVYDYDETEDPYGRLTDVYRSNGAHVETDWSELSCCRTKTVVDETGQEIEYQYDARGRLIEQTKKGVAAYGSYAAQSDVTTTYTYGTKAATGFRYVLTNVSDGALELNSERVYDLAGRLRYEYQLEPDDDVIFTTEYEYGVEDLGTPQDPDVVYVVRKTTQPGTADEIETVSAYTLDQQLRSVTGAGVVEQHYEYGVNAGGERWTKTYAGKDASNDWTKRWSKRTVDMLGRTITEERPAYDMGTVSTTYAYHADTATSPGFPGELASVTPPHQAPTYYEYDSLGAVVRTWMDADESGTLVLASWDRVNEQTTTYEQDASNDWWRVTETTTYGLYNLSPSATPITVGRQMQRVSGFTTNVLAESRSVSYFEDALSQLQEVVAAQTTTVDRTNALVTVTTDVPDATQNAAQVSYNGRVMETTSQTGATVTYAYDGLGRQTHVYGPRPNVWRQTLYSADTGRVIEARASCPTAVDGDGYTSQFLTYDTYGRVTAVQDHDGDMSYTSYTDRGEVEHVWGDTPSPLAFTYDGYGQRESLSTFRGGTSWSNSTWPTGETADVTEWEYDDATGLLETKRYAQDSNSEVTYTYTADGRPATRTWARGVVTTYSYQDGVATSTNTGELYQVVYSNEPAGQPSTPTVSFAYTRQGQFLAAVDTLGTRFFYYRMDNPALLKKEQFLAGDYAGWITSRVYEEAAAPYGRYTGVQIGTSGDADAYYASSYGYEAATGRPNRVTGPGLPAHTSEGAHYAYDANSDALASVAFGDVAAGQPLAQTTYTYEGERDVIASVGNSWFDASSPYTETVVSGYAYVYDALGRPTQKTRTGVAMTQGRAFETYDVFGYDDRSELNFFERRRLSTSSIIYDESFEYDPIGNREQWNDYTGTPIPGDDYVGYTSNAFNQYEQTQTNEYGSASFAVRPLDYDDDGNLTQYVMIGDMNCDGLLNSDDLYPMYLAVNDPTTYESTYPTCDRLEQGDIDGDDDVDGDDYLLLQYEVLTNPDYGTVFEYDGENRLIGKRPTVGHAGAKLVRYAYDYMGRRVEKRIYDWDDQAEDWEATPTLHRKFVWDGWRLVLELDGLDSDSVIRKYTWGLDLSGTLESAGGIRGLLALHAPESAPAAGDEKDYIYFYDSLGNVTQLLNLDTSTSQTWSDSRLAAYYEYRPFGATHLSGGDYADDNPFHFQTKYLDDETGFGYWGYRYYSFDLGRWITRDPIGEEGGGNLYRYGKNASTIFIDADGRMPLRYCLFPDAPSEPEGSDTGSSIGRPSDVDVWNPWLRWIIARRDEDYYISPSSSFGKYVLGLATTTSLESKAYANINNRLVSECSCGAGNYGTDKNILVSGFESLHSSTTYDEYNSGRWLGAIWAFANINGIHMDYWARCNIRSCCGHCKASCRVEYDVYDSFHFDINPVARGPLHGRGFAAYWWHIVYQKVQLFVVPCPKG